LPQGLPARCDAFDLGALLIASIPVSRAAAMVALMPDLRPPKLAEAANAASQVARGRARRLGAQESHASSH
jgi:hypothetical protein